MSQVVLFQPVNQWFLSWLREKLRPLEGAVWLSDRWPLESESQVRTWVAVRDDGSELLDSLIRVTHLSITVSAPSAERADALAELVHAALRLPEAVISTPVCRINGLHGPVQVSDRTHQHLRTLTADLLVTGSIVDL